MFPSILNAGTSVPLPPPVALPTLSQAFLYRPLQIGTKKLGTTNVKVDNLLRRDLIVSIVSVRAKKELREKNAALRQQATSTPLPSASRNVMSINFITSPVTSVEVEQPVANTATPVAAMSHDEMASPASSSTSSNDGSLCSKRNCNRHPKSAFGQFCEFHKPSRLCKVVDCHKCAKTGGYCIAHGGGRRCLVPDCDKSAKEGGLCIAHGGGKRCKHERCTKSALTGGFCSAHGGGKRCSMDGCFKTALKGGLCIAHGGGKRCEMPNCTKSAVGGHFCVSHGGGRRCRVDGCQKGAVRHGVCIRHGAKK